MKHVAKLLVRVGLLTATLFAALTGASQAHAASSDKWLLVSDIDDTIKQTHVLSTTGMIVNGAWNAYPFAQMNLAYHLFTRGSATGERVIAYVTGAPGPLQALSKSFLLDSDFPDGIFTGRPIDISYPDDNILPSVSLQETKAFKIESIKKLALQFPEHNLLLIGDNGQLDVETYAEVTAWMRANFPEREVHTFIHNVYSRKLGHEILPSQFVYVTAGDLALQLFSLGIFSEREVALTLVEVSKTYASHRTAVIPAWMNCQDVIEEKKLAGVPTKLHLPTAEAAFNLLLAIDARCRLVPQRQP